MTHTKGPWNVQGASIVSDNAITVATVPIGTGAGQDNARLIAAAPELLHALNTIMEDTESLYIREIAGEAICKARGE